MVDFRLKSSGNITGNGYVDAFSNGQFCITASSTNLTKVLVGGVSIFNTAAVSYVQLRDGQTGPVAYFANITGENRTTFPMPLYFTNGVYVNHAIATGNVILLTV